MDRIERAILVRSPSTDDGTPGAIYLRHKKFCYTLELPWINNEQDRSCIPVGQYRCEFSYSPIFKKYFYELQEVKNRNDIMIHSGNFAGDISLGKKSHTKGCILVGMAYGEMDGQLVVTVSRTTIGRLHEYFNKLPFILDII